MGKFYAGMGDKKFVVLVFVLWRGLLFFFEAGAMVLLPFRRSFPYADTILIPTGLPQWLWQWGNFDGVHYLMLARSGYDGFGTQVFFPAYPLLTRLVTVFTGSYLVSGLLISHLAVLVAGMIFFQLVRRLFDERTAKWSVLFLFFFPTSFFFASMYTESLFLMLVLLAFTLSGFWSVVLAGVAGATRLTGVFVTPTFFLRKKINWLGALSLVGLLSYMFFLWWRFGNPIFFLSAQAAFQNSRAATLTSLVNPLQVLVRYLRILITADHTQLDLWVAVLELSAFLLGVGVLGWLTWKKRLKIDLLIFGWASLLLPTFSGSLSSMPRYLLGVFPVLIGLGMIRSKALKTFILAIFVLLLALLTGLFTRGYFVS